MRIAWTILGSVLMLAVLALLGFLGFRFENVATGFPSHYMSELSLVVTIVAAVAGLFGLGGIFTSYRAIAVSEQAAKRGAEIETLAEDVKSKITNAQDEVDLHLEAMKMSSGAFHPSDLRLNVGILELAENQSVLSLPTQEALKTVLAELASLHRANSEFTAQVRKLFSLNTDEVVGSAMFLAHQPPDLARPLIDDRIVIEKQRTKPNSELVEVLARVIGRLEAKQVHTDVLRD